MSKVWLQGQNVSKFWFFMSTFWFFSSKFVKFLVLRSKFSFSGQNCCSKAKNCQNFCNKVKMCPNFDFSCQHFGFLAQICQNLVFSSQNCCLKVNQLSKLWFSRQISSVFRSKDNCLTHQPSMPSQISILNDIKLKFTSTNPRKYLLNRRINKA